jgi:hypothetical protein
MGSRLVSRPRPHRVAVHPGRKAGHPVKVAANTEAREPACRQLVSRPRPHRVAVHPGRKAGRPVKVAANTEEREPACRQLVQAQPAPLVKPNTKRKERLRKDHPLLRRSNSVEQLRKPRPRILSEAALCTRSPASNI